MDEGLLREIATDYLLPFFSGARIEKNTATSNQYHQLVAFRDHLTMYFKVNPGDRYRLALHRPQSFITRASKVIPERDVVEAFVSVLGEMESILTTNLKQDLLSTFQRRVIARAIYNGKRESTILAGIDQMARWSNRLYEGTPISAAIGFKLTNTHGPISLQSLASHDLAAVLSNGFDTLLEFNFDGEFLGHESLSQGTALPSYCPMRQAHIADWTTKHDVRLALSLNRLGEILIFRQEELLFARRSGRWHFLTHAPVIAQMNVPRDLALRRAIYETCLDASFARTGACIGVVSREHSNEWQSLVVQEADHLTANTSDKAKALNAVTKGRSFGTLDRRVRQEIAAIDGALVLSHTGTIHAVGAILRIEGGSTGGGRLAAAKALGRLGLGVKVSQDGGITGFRGRRTNPVFRVMS
jgi:hypothetical protein